MSKRQKPFRRVVSVSQHADVRECLTFIQANASDRWIIKAMVDALETTGRLRCVAELSADCQEIRAVAVVTLYDDGSAIRLRDIVVSAQRRREGFGSLLLDEIVLLGRDKFENVYWRVFDSDQAPATFVSFLLSNGFAHTPDEMGLILRVAGVKRSPAQRLAIREGKQAAKWWNEAFAQPWYEESRING